MISNYQKDWSKPYKFKRFKNLIIDPSNKLRLEKKVSGYYLNNHLIVKGRCKIDLLLDYISQSFKITNRNNYMVEFERV